MYRLDKPLVDTSNLSRLGYLVICTGYCVGEVLPKEEHPEYVDERHRRTALSIRHHISTRPPGLVLLQESGNLKSYDGHRIPNIVEVVGACASACAAIAVQDMLTIGRTVVVNPALLLDWNENPIKTVPPSMAWKFMKLYLVLCEGVHPRYYYDGTYYQMTL